MNLDITFDINDCERAVSHVSVKEDNRWYMVNNILYAIDDKNDNYLQEFLMRGSMSTWYHGGKNSGTYLFCHDKILLFAPNCSKFLQCENKDSIFVYSETSSAHRTIQKICKQQFSIEHFNCTEYTNSLHFEHGNLYLGGSDKVSRLDPANPSAVLHSWEIENSAYVNYCKQLNKNYLFVKTKFKGAYLINLNTNQKRKIFSKDQCKWIDFSHSSKKAVIRGNCGPLYCYRIHGEFFTDKEALPFSKSNSFQFLPANENLLVIHHKDVVSVGYSFYDTAKRHTIARVRTDNWVKDFYSTHDFQLAYCSIDKQLYKTDYRTLVNYWNYKKRRLNNNETIIIDKRKNFNPPTEIEPYDEYIYW
jgi:hypothetical protein